MSGSEALSTRRKHVALPTKHQLEGWSHLSPSCFPTRPRYCAAHSEAYALSITFDGIRHKLMRIKVLLRGLNKEQRSTTWVQCGSRYNVRRRLSALCLLS